MGYRIISGRKRSVLFLFGILSFLVMHCNISTVMAAGELRVGWSTTEMLDTLQTGETWQYETMGCMFWQLVYDQAYHFGAPPDYSTELRAVTEVKTADNKKFQYTIREGMTFHDAKPVTAKDFAFTYKHLPQNSPVWAFYDTVTVEDSFTVIDDHTFEFELEKTIAPKYPPFNWYPILPEHIWRRYKFEMTDYTNKKPVGSGPFKLREFKSGEYMIFENFEDYWEKKPRVDKVIFKGYGGSDAINMALKRGDIDMIGYAGISPLSMKFLENQKNIEILISPGSSLWWVTFNLFMDGPLRNVNVRKAIAHGIDKDKIAEMVFHGYVKPADSFVYPELSEYNPNLPQYKYNNDMANKILDDGGYLDTDGDGIRNDPETGENMKFSFIASSDVAEDVKVVTLIREQLKGIGIDIRIKVMDYDTYVDMYYYPEGAGFDMALHNIDPGPYGSWIWEYMRSHEAGGAGWNTAYYSNPAFDKALDEYLQVVDLDERKALSWKLQEILATDIPHYVLCRPDIIEPVRTDKLTGYTPKMGGISSWINPFTYFNVHAK
ncbi:MAG: peptide ABC transporter substrate-binding protein [Desulfobacterales bacterium]|nr:peptide ABC transporter substrate-binding protein [Desulfobacterales bacterium]